MMSISPDARKVQKSCFFANVNVDGKQLKQIKKKVFNSPFRKGGYWHVADEEWGEDEKKDLVREVGETKMAAVF